MNNKNKIIVALDVNNIDDARALVRDLNPYVGAFKVGLEIMNACGAPQVVSALKEEGAEKIFFDAKFKDIPNTVAGAVRAATSLGVWMFNVHALGGRKMMEETLKASKETASGLSIDKPIILAVTILTSFNPMQLSELGLKVNSDKDLQDEVLRLALLAKEAGLDGVVASPQEISLIREACGPDFKIVTPGVRPVWATKCDQQRVMTPKDAINAGADYLVIGRPITKPPESVGSSVIAAKKILEEI